MKRLIFLFFLIGSIVGSSPFLLKEYILSLAPKVTASGVLKFQPSPNPSLTAAQPEGHYVESRIYVENVDTTLLGKYVIINGTLKSIPDSDYYLSYPLIVK